MRPRHLLILLLLGAVPVALALLLAGGGGTKRARGVPVAQLSLQLIDGSSAVALAACGVTHHYTAYRAGATVRFRGRITQPGNWSVTLKLKACTSGAFRPSGGATGKVLPDRSSYEGSFPAPIGGYYFARAELKQGNALVARSDKRYFHVR